MFGAAFDKKLCHPKRWEESQFEKTKQKSELNSDMINIWKLLDKKFKITMIKMLKLLMKKCRHIQEQMGNVSTEIEILRKDQQEILKIKTIVQKWRMAWLVSSAGWI